MESAALDWLESLGRAVKHGPDIAPDAPGAERRDYGQVVLEQRLRDALARLNLDLPAEALADAFRRVTQPEGATLEARNRAFHRMLAEQLQTYKAELPTLFAFNELLVISDGVGARLGTLTAAWEWFKPWRTSSVSRSKTWACRSLRCY